MAADNRARWWLVLVPGLAAVLAITWALFERQVTPDEDAASAPMGTAPLPDAGSPEPERGAAPCGVELRLPLPPCVALGHREAEETPLVAPQVIGPGVLRMALPAYRLAEADALVRAAVGTASGDEHVFVDVQPQGDSLIHAGRCPGESSYLAAFTLDAAGAMHLLCLEYVPASEEPVRAEDLGFFGRAQRCRGPRAWHGAVTGATTTTWSAPTWLPDLCESPIKHDVVLAIAGASPMVAYCARAELACAWRVTLLADGRVNHALTREQRNDAASAPHGFFVSGGALSSIVSTPDASGRFETGYELVTLDSRDRLRRSAIPLTLPQPVEPLGFPRRGPGRSPRGVTSWMSDDAEVLEMLLPLSLLEQPSLDLYPLAQPYSVAGARSPTGLRSLGPELRVLPFDDGETDFARLELPGDTTVTLSDMSVHWLRASCSGACVATYSTLQEERSATESYPASLRVLRTGALGGLPANADCEAHVGGDISCQQKK